MSNDHRQMGEQVAGAWPANDAARAPAFDVAWGAAQARYVSGRRKYRGFAAAAAIAVVIGLTLRPGVDDHTYVEVGEILESTTWSAPSDVLLPEYQIDIYRELPSFIESTEPAGGSLL